MNQSLQTIKAWLGKYWAPVIAIGLWLFLGMQYVGTTSPELRAIDGLHHVEYTLIISQKHRLPAPYEAWETYHPPLYYMVDALFAPSSVNHIRYVRQVSVVYGAIFLLAMWIVLKKAKISSSFIYVAVLFLTFLSPSFFILFTAYNNDALSALLCALLLLYSYVFIVTPNRWHAVLLLAVTILALYTKLNAVFAIVSVGVVVLCGVCAKKINIRHACRMLIVFAIAILAFLPWMVFHNLPLSGKMLPNNFNGIATSIKLPRNALSMILTPPAISDGEWGYPYTLGSQEFYHLKMNVYSFLFDTSAFSGFSYPQPLETRAWLIVWLSLFIGALSLSQVRHNVMTLASGGIIIVSLVLIALFTPYVGFISGADFRYIAWTWLAWGVLTAFVLERISRRGYSTAGNIIILCSILGLVLVKYSFITYLLGYSV
jgi:hypothetical protein